MAVAQIWVAWVATNQYETYYRKYNPAGLFQQDFLDGRGRELMFVADKLNCKSYCKYIKF